MRNLWWVSFCFVVCSQLNASTPLATDAVQRAIVFLYAANTDGSANERSPIGTGFLVAMHQKRSPTNIAVLLITARHIVEPDWAYCAGSRPNVLYVRINKKKYDPSKDSTGVEYLRVTLVANGQEKYLVSDDDKVDAAVVDFGAMKYSQNDYDFVPMELAVFASADEIAKLGIGDSIASAGLIPGRSGEKRNYPFFKFGNISSKPDEAVWANCDEKMPALRRERVWFIAANLVGGNSGSPVFYLPLGTGSMILGGNVNRVVLVGVQSLSFAGADIAGMTPIEDVFQIIAKSAPTYDLYRGDLDHKPKE